MKRTEVLIIGGGQAGLAMSRALSDRDIRHVVLERGRVAERWRSERWDSLTLLTPNWQSRLPGYSYTGSDPDGYMSIPEVIQYLQGYADSFRAPVETDTTVVSVERQPGGYLVKTNRGDWSAASVVIATGDCDVPRVPAMANDLPVDIHQVVPSSYKNPDQLPASGVLVVGASATGVQLADEIHRSGRPVTLAVGRHTRLPRRYRGRDILWWLDAMGLFDQKADGVFDIDVSRRQPSLQLNGRRQQPVDLLALAHRGVRLRGRVTSVQGSRVDFRDDLLATVASADVKLWDLLSRIDAFVEERGMEDQVDPPRVFRPLTPAIDARYPTRLDLERENIGSVVWATGFRREYPWLHVPILDERGEIRHRQGITSSEGLYVMGLRFLRRRKSSFIDGVGPDALELSAHIAERLVAGRASAIA